MSRDVGVGQLVQELQQRGDRLPFEIGAFVALEACEGLLQQSVRLGADDVRVTVEGSVILSQSAERAEPDEAARSLVSVLARLLTAAGPGVPPYLTELVQETGTGQHPHDLRHLHDAIEASLIPINRGASRRVLARLVRESDRPPAPVARHQIDPHELDAELDELLRDPVSRTLEPEQARLPSTVDEDEEPITERIRIPDVVTRGASREDRQEGIATAAAQRTRWESAPQPITATIRKWQPLDRDSETELASAPATVSAAVPETAAVPEPAAVPVPVSTIVAVSATEPVPVPLSATVQTSPTALTPVPVPVPVPESEPVSVSATALSSDSAFVSETSAPSAREPGYDRASLPESRLPKRRGGWGVWVLAAGLGLGAYALARTPALRSVLDSGTPRAAPVPGGLIEVNVSPADAQIFVFVGRGPALASGLPVDGAHEFVVFDRGLRPSRGVVPKGASWTSTEQGFLYELAVQAQPAGTASDALDLGRPEALPASADEKGRLGTVRVITNPQGAKVYRFVGLGPRTLIRASSIQEGQEILVYHPEHETRRAVIGPSDWQPGADQGAYEASLEVELPPLPASVVPETPKH
ncbi:MAG: hypothetical protein WCE62_22150 [Polyangiales bacterium]